MPARIPCEFSLIRYVPDVVKGEFTNIGVLLREVANGGAAQLRFTRDWSRVRCMDANADIGLLEALEAEIAGRLRERAADRGSLAKPILDVLNDSLSNSIQISEPRACLAESVPAELELLMQMYVEPLKVKRAPRRTGRAAIAAAMRRQFETAGVWEMMRKRIAASTYTMPGDPMKLDCGYRPSAGTEAHGAIRIFHAVSLEGDSEAAKVLAWSAPRLREGIRRVESAELDLAAVVEPLRAVVGEPEEPATEAREQYRFGVAAMEAQQIRVITTLDLARAAETARRELRL